MCIYSNLNDTKMQKNIMCFRKDLEQTQKVVSKMSDITILVIPEQ